MVEMEDLLPKMKILQSGGTTRPYSQRILIVGNRHSLLSCQRRNIISRDLVGFTALSLITFWSFNRALLRWLFTALFAMLAPFAD
jgi:hypothetical protein